MIIWLTRDWGLKLVALVLAIGLWFYAVGEESVEVERTVPLEIYVQNKQMSMLKASVKSVRVKLVAPRTRISEIASKDIHAKHVIGAEVKTAGDYSFRLEAREIRVPSPDIRVMEITPSVVVVTLDEVIVQKLLVKPKFVGEPAYGYKVKEDEIRIDPNALLVEGPKGKLEKIDSISTERIDLVGRIRSLRRTVKLDLPEGVRPLSEEMIDIMIPIKEESGEKAFDHIPIKILQAPGQGLNYELSVQEVSFVVRGPEVALSGLTADKILAYLDLSALKPGETEARVQLQLPEDISVKDEAALKVKISVKPAAK
ncbi:MAG: hypothetical protein KBC91_05450 [Candidatus Omnitrophica bacterium]|nr:hypothetical protein [Candidatus Omnitrophota bacterium]